VFSVAREINFCVISVRGAEIWSQVARATKARSVAPSICVSSVGSVLCFILLAPRIVKWQPLFYYFVINIVHTRFSALQAVNDFFSFVSTLFVYHRKEGLSWNGELERVWKGGVVACFKV
jgi:hypothetical protein